MTADPASPATAAGAGTGVPELDLGEAGRAGGDPARPARTRSLPPAWIRALAVGLVAGGLAVHVLDSAVHPAPGPAPAPAQLRLAFGALPSEVESLADHGQAVVDLFAVVANDGTEPLTLVSIRVSGLGAALIDPGPRWQAPHLPLTVLAGGERDLPLAITSDCVFIGRPVPAVTLLVRDGAGVVHEQPARVPDLERLWDESLRSVACKDAVPELSIGTPQ